MEIITITAYALLVILALLGFRKLSSKVQDSQQSLEKALLLLRNSSKREQVIKYDLARQKSKLERIVKRLQKN